MKISLTEKELRKIVSESINSVLRKKKMLAEASKTIPFQEFVGIMDDLGFRIESGGKGSGYKFYFKDKDESKLYPRLRPFTVHSHNGGKEIDPGVLQQITNALIDCGWLKKKENFDKYPFERFQVGSKKIDVDRSSEEIEKANEEYKDADVLPIYAKEKFNVCFLHNIVINLWNLCKGPNDRRPLLKQWFDEIVYDKDSNPYFRELYCKDNDCFVKQHQIFPDGSIDKQGILAEHRSKKFLNLKEVYEKHLPQYTRNFSRKK